MKKDMKTGKGMKTRGTPTACLSGFARQTMMLAGLLVTGLAFESVPVNGVAVAGTTAADAPAVPSTPPLTNDQIVQLMDGKSFQFKNYDRPLTGTTHWDIKAHRVNGDYNYSGIFKGDFKADWDVTDNKSCTKDHYQGTVCLTVYAYGPGFMEVSSDGKIHAVSIPK